MDKDLKQLDILLKQSEIDFLEEDKITSNLGDVDFWLIRQISSRIQNDIKKIDSIESAIDILNEKYFKNDKFSKYRPLNYSSSINASENKFYSSKVFNDWEYDFKSSYEAKIIVPFISNNGIKNIDFYLKENPTLKVKILTTTFDGTSKFLSVDTLAELCKNFPDRVELKIEDSLKTRNNRIHAKTYIFKNLYRENSAYIGSSNLSDYGLINGEEWNIRISEFSDKKLLNNIDEAFENKWNNVCEISLEEALKQRVEYFEKEKEYNRYIKKIEQEMKLETLSKETKVWKPYDYQIDIINNINNRVLNNKHKHLIVMATGTGKTPTINFIMQNLNKNFYKEKTKNEMIFIVNNINILEQSKNVFLSMNSDVEESEIACVYDGNFDKNNNISDYKYIFGTQKSLSFFEDELLKLKFKYLIIDETHHLSTRNDENGNTEYNILSELFVSLSKNASETFGLTATPFRTEGLDVKIFFENEYAYQLDLPTSVENNYLCNFDYWTISDDSLDMSGIKLNNDKDSKEKYIKQISTPRFREFFIKTLNETVGIYDNKSSSVIFCSFIDDAILISDLLNENGYKSAHYVSGVDTGNDPLNNFKNGDINFLCVVNKLTEGIDIPKIDRVFFLRPTTSPIVFLQQLGRGLRLDGEKRLQVYDFVRNIDIKRNRNYDPLGFVRNITRPIDMRNASVVINNINNYIPGNSRMYITQESREKILNNIREMNKLSKPWVNEINSQNSKTFLENYVIFETTLNTYDLELFEYYKYRTYYAENNDYSFAFKNISTINNVHILKMILKAFEQNKIPENDLVAKIIYGSFIKSGNDKRMNGDFNENLKMILNNSYYCDEIKLLITFMLKNKKEYFIDKVVDNNMISFKGTFFQWAQLLCFEGFFVREVDGKLICNVSPESHGFRTSYYNEELVSTILMTNYNVPHKGALYKENNFSYQNHKLEWLSPSAWKYVGDDIDKMNPQLRDFINTNYKNTNVFVKTKKIFDYFNLEDNSDKNITVAEYVGQIDYIESFGGFDYPENNKKSYKFIFKIK